MVFNGFNGFFCGVLRGFFKKIMKNESTVDWNINYPKDKDLKFWKMMGKGDYQVVPMPSFSYDTVVYNEKNLRINRPKDSSTLERFFV